MRLLLDTHALLWFVEGENKLSYISRTFIEDPDNQLFVSMASFFELGIKLKINKISMSKSLQDVYRQTLIEKITILPISEKHIFEYLNFSFAEDHRDPFDRIIVATAAYEKLDIISIDEKIKQYNGIINVIW
jgi:PIN domain nuclease of toxin-antitoxin system